MEFLKDMDYTDEERFHYYETQYYEKISPDPKEGRTMWIWLRPRKIDTPDVSKFYQYFIDIEFTARFLKDVEVMHEGEKMKAQSGYMEIMIDAGVFTDREGKWRNHWLLKHLYHFFLERVWYKQFEDKKHVAKEDAQKLAQQIKMYFELESFLHTKPEAFVPSHGYKDKFVPQSK